MKEAIANAGIFNLIIIFVVILMAFFVGSLGYSKAFKVKNKIVEEIEKDEGYSPYDRDVLIADDGTTQDRIERWLGTIGYRMNTGASTARCERVIDSNAVNGGNVINNGNDYQYCIYEFNTCASRRASKCSRYYRVISYMYFDIPIIGDMIAVPVVGETKPVVTLNN